MTLDAARRHAREHHPQVLAARERVKAALVRADVPGAAWLPEISAAAQVLGATTNNSTTTLLGQPGVDTPRIGATTLDDDFDLRPHASSAVAVGLRQQLYDFGRVEAETGAERLLAEVQRHLLDGSRLDVDAAVVQAFYGVLSAKALLAAAQEALARASSHRELATAGVRSGMRPAIEQPRAEADVARATLGVLRAESGLHVARTLFAAACGVEERQLDAEGAEPVLGPLPSLDELISHASSHDPNMRAAAARLQAQQARTEALAATARPRLSATAGLSGRAGGAPPNDGPRVYGDGFLPVVPNWHVGVLFTWPLFQASVRRGVAVSEQLERVTAREANALGREQLANVASAYEQAALAQRALASVDGALVAARSNYAMAEERFRVGLGTSIELSDAQALLTQSEVELILARFQAARARAALARAAAEES